MSNIERAAAPSPVLASGMLDQLKSRPTAKVLAVLEHNTIVRSAQVQSEAIVQAQRLDAVDQLTEKAMSGQAMLSRWRDTLGGSDPLLHDELKLFTDVARLAKAELIGDLVQTFRNTGRCGR